MAKNPAISTYAKLIGEVAIQWNILERRLDSLVFHYLTVESKVAGFILGEMGNETKANFAKFLIEAYEKDDTLRESGLFALLFLNRVRENRNVLEHSTPHLDYDWAYSGSIEKSDKRGKRRAFVAPVPQLKELVSDMRHAETYFEILQTVLHTSIYGAPDRYKGGPTIGEAMVRAHALLPRPRLPDKLSPLEPVEVPTT